MNRVIFLDFDGVILTLRTQFASGRRVHACARPDPLACSVIRRCCQKVGIRLVVSSSWRIGEEITRAKLRQAKLHAELHVDWRTPVLGERPAEISHWLARHPEVSDYRILDDEDFTWTEPHRDKWIRCCPNDGIPAEGMRELLGWAGLLQPRG